LAQYQDPAIKCKYPIGAGGVLWGIKGGLREGGGCNNNNKKPLCWEGLGGHLRRYFLSSYATLPISITRARGMNIILRLLVCGG
jgi:hypothetical protein